MRVLLLGVGMQGRAALSDLAASDVVTEIIAVDREIEKLRSYVDHLSCREKIRLEGIDVENPAELDQLFGQGADVAIDLLPVGSIGAVASAAIRHRIHLVNTFFVTPELRSIAHLAEESGITILPEFGLDPGIDLVLLGEAARTLDVIDEVHSYGAGIPEWEAAGNPLHYKVSWTIVGVLGAYRDDARLIRKGTILDIPADQLFSPENVHEIEIGSVGRLEAFPNRDVTDCIRALGLDPSHIRAAGRYTMRWPGHASFWKKLVDLRFLDQQPVLVDGTEVDRKAYLAALLEPQLRYGQQERDLAIVRIELHGTKNGRAARAVFQVVDRRDLKTGHLAMARTVGYTASIGAQMIASGAVRRPGLASPVRDIDYHVFSAELSKRGIGIESDLSFED